MEVVCLSASNTHKLLAGIRVLDEGVVDTNFDVNNLKERHACCIALRDLTVGVMSIPLIVDNRLPNAWIDITHDDFDNMDTTPSQSNKLEAIYNSGVTSTTIDKNLNFDSSLA